jgi:hypothetical protein
LKAQVRQVLLRARIGKRYKLKFGAVAFLLAADARFLFCEKYLALALTNGNGEDRSEVAKYAFVYNSELVPE